MINESFKIRVERVRNMNLPSGSYAIFGSGPLAIRGLKEPGDVDVLMTKDVYNTVKTQPGWVEKPFEGGIKYFLENDGIELWYKWGPGEWDSDELIKSADIIDGLPYVKLNHVVAWKEKIGRPKDLQDIQKIYEYLKNNSEQITSE